MAFALALRCSNELSYEDPYIESRPIELILTHKGNDTRNDDVNCGNTVVIAI